MALAKRAKATGKNYSRLLYLYWTRNPRFRGFKSTAQWLDEVREQQDSPDIIVRRAWGKELEAFNLSYKGKAGNFASKSQNNLRATVLSYFKFHIGEPEDYSFTLGTEDQLKEEARQREAETPPTREELKALYNQCRTNRDRALLLSLIHGFGLSEWLDFANSWYQYRGDIEAGTVPLKVTMPFRSKTLRKSKVDSYTYLWDDSVEALKELLHERKRELGRDLTKSDNLFQTDQRQPLNDNRIEILFRHLAERSGLFTQIGRLHRLRPHKIGRTFFTTEAVNAGVDPAIREFVLMHKTDQFGGAYNKFHQTVKGQELIRRELLKLRPVLNLKSDKGTEISKENYFEQTIETLAISKGKDPQEVKSAILAILARGGDFQKLYAQMETEARMRMPPMSTIHPMVKILEPEKVAAHMTPEQIRPAVMAWVKSLEAPGPANSPDQVVDVDSGELDTYLKLGWRFVSIVNAKKAVVRWESKQTPIYPAVSNGILDENTAFGVGTKPSAKEGVQA
jgi:site-specific recombinase XerD